MAARTLVQALEGVSFPCDRAQLIEYARRNSVGNRTLAVLEEIPERQYRDLGEVFTALPGFPQAGQQREPQQEGQQSEEELQAVSMVLEWWLAGFRQAMLPWEMTALCLRGSVEIWPQWMRLGQHLWFPWSK